MLVGFLSVVVASAVQTAIFLALFCLVYQFLTKRSWRNPLLPLNCKLMFTITAIISLFRFFSAPLVTLASLAGTALVLFVVAPWLYDPN